MNFFFIDKILPFLKNKENIEKLENLNLFQFYLNRFGINSNISKKIIKYSAVFFSLKIKKYNINIINSKIKYIFIDSLDNLDILLEQKMNIKIKKDIFLYTYRGDRYLLKLPLNGQRRRSNAKTIKKIKLIK